ncbi:hypothetical protein [sulfur-oxidizing endosymbiont of Gigantopelta aegis]|uniref:hypothetical protein n=1 Tax=sulfur-oxidizing endosymbiont of Gigantopelta aegis TaxID=2794934 RepID=UPI0018DC0BF0|nr:hypothetical protein [sulfur-oxidizing endosymbiont of Gigantopelta aegis]
MKFKNIKSFTHNLTHSYVSFENYIDGEFVFNSLKEMAYAANGEKVSIYWISPKDKIQPLFNERVNKSIEYYKEWIPKLMLQHEIEKETVVELRTDIYLAKNKQIEVQAYARELNGKEYIKNIYEFADIKSYDGEA